PSPCEDPGVPSFGNPSGRPRAGLGLPATGSVVASASPRVTTVRRRSSGDRRRTGPGSCRAWRFMPPRPAGSRRRALVLPRPGAGAERLVVARLPVPIALSSTLEAPAGFTESFMALLLIARVLHDSARKAGPARARSRSRRTGCFHPVAGRYDA